MSPFMYVASHKKEEKEAATYLPRRVIAGFLLIISKYRGLEAT